MTACARMALGFALVLAMTAARAASAQPRRSPAPSGSAATPVVSTVEPRPASVHFEPCAYSMVYLTSKVWRECCVLCSGSDGQSKAELAESRADTTGSGAAVVNQYFTIQRDEPDHSRSERSKDAASDKPAPKARTRYGGFKGLQPLTPRFGGFD
jgi:hypothetical protein